MHQEELNLEEKSIKREEVLDMDLLKRKEKQIEEPQPISLGKQLKKARDVLKLNSQDLADQLRLSHAIIEAIENDDFNHQNMIFMRGYIRSYANFVHFPQEKVTAAFIALGWVEPNKVHATLHFNTRQHSTRDKPVKLITYFIILLLIILVLAWCYMNYSSENKSVSNTPTTPPVVQNSTPPTANAVPTTVSGITKKEAS